jgi:hypothetical protein
MAERPATLAAKIEAAGGPKLDPTQSTGTATAETALGKVTLSWVVTGVNQQYIAVSLVKKPWELPASTVWEHVDQLFT